MTPSRWYDGVEFAWDKRFSHGMQFQAAYTYSQSEDTTSEATAVGPGDSNQLGPDSKFARAKAALPHAAPVHVQRQLSPAVLREPDGPARTGVRRLDDLGRGEADLRHAVHRDDIGRRPRLRWFRGGPAGAAGSLDPWHARQPPGHVAGGAPAFGLPCRDVRRLRRGSRSAQLVLRRWRQERGPGAVEDFPYAVGSR